MTHYNDKLSDYITELFASQDDALRLAREDSVRKGLPAISVKPEEGRFLQFLVRACGARKALEIGTLGGYSGIWIARGLAPGGKLITLEKDPYHAQVAREHFASAGVEDLVEVRVGDAHQQLTELVAEAPFDFVFIDAEKEGYNAYFDWALANTRSNGVIAAHNAFRGGSIVGERADDTYTEMMRSFNRRVAEEPRVISTIFPAGDGTLLAVKISQATRP
ncbi:MAG: O-methyltransferase [Candidatus Methanosuratincola sp.]